MNSRVRRFLLASFLAVIALAGAFNMYLSIRLGHMMRDLLRGLGLRVGDPRVAWDSWFLVAISAMSIMGIIGVLWRKRWGTLVSSIVFVPIVRRRRNGNFKLSLSR